MLINFFKILVGVVLALVLFGVVWGIDLVYLIASLVVLRCWVLFRHWLIKPATASDWDALGQSFREEVKLLDFEALVQLKSELKLPEDATQEEVVEAYIQEAKTTYRPPRVKVELLCELVGIVSYLLLCPLIFALFGLDFVSVNLPLTWGAFLLLLIGFIAYIAPFLIWREADAVRSRCIWWCLPFFPFLILVLYGVEVRHPYLNPGHPERERIAAERVLEMNNIIESGRHAGIVKRYGQFLESQGNEQQALSIYEAALRLDPSDDALRRRIASKSKLDEGMESVAWQVENTSKRKELTGAIQTISVGSDLFALDEFTVVIVSVGKVPDSIKRQTAETIRRELMVEAVIAAGEAVPLPEHTRRRGLIIGKQWEARVIAGAFAAAYPDLPVAPVKYLILTPADTYVAGSNYLFSGSWPWGAFVSFARYEGAGNLLVERTAKQSLCALIKVFPIKPSTDRECVTSYCRSVQEFDQKGSVPSDAILSEFHAYVDNFNTQWQYYKAGIQSRK